MTISLSWWVTDVFAVLPTHFLGRPYLEVFTLLLLQNVTVSVTRVLSPTSKHNDVGARDIESVAISRLWRKSGDSESRPDESIGVEYSNVIEVTLLNI